MEFGIVLLLMLSLVACGDETEPEYFSDVSAGPNGCERRVNILKTEIETLQTELDQCQDATIK
jgi:hypothetical protein